MSPRVAGPRRSEEMLVTADGTGVVDSTDRVDGIDSADGDQVPDLHLVRPLPGFLGLTRFALVRVGDSDGSDGEEPGVLYELRSLENADVRFVVAVPTAFFPDYAFELDNDICRDLELSDPADALVLVLLTIDADAASTTANLLAPVVINARTRSAAQVILSGSGWPVRAAVV